MMLSLHCLSTSHQKPVSRPFLPSIVVLKINIKKYIPAYLFPIFSPPQFYLLWYKPAVLDIVTDLTLNCSVVSLLSGVSGNWIEIAYGTSSGAVRVIVQHPETVGSGPQLFQTFTVHRSPVTKIMLSEKHLVSGEESVTGRRVSAIISRSWRSCDWNLVWPFAFFSVCVSVRGQQPRPDMDGDTIQRNDLHPARLHPAGLLQDTVPGGDGKSWELLLWEWYRWES